MFGVTNATADTALAPPGLDLLVSDALGAMRAAGLPFETLEPNAGWKRHAKQDALWYIVDAGTGRNGRPWLQVSAGDARITGGVDEATFTWKSWTRDHEALTPAELQEIKDELREAAQRREAQQQKARQAAAEQATNTWSCSSMGVDGHAYLRSKGVGAYGLRRLGAHLLVPVADMQGQLHGLQSIGPEGTKRFNPGAAVAGHFHLLGSIGKRLYLAEGYATAATIHEATGEATACATPGAPLHQRGGPPAHRRPSRVGGHMDKPKQPPIASQRPPSPLLTEIEAAEYFRLSHRTLCKWRCLGLGPRFIKVGRLPRYRLSDLEAWLANRASGGGDQ